MTTAFRLRPAAWVLWLLVGSAVATTASAAQTLRLDYYHFGDATQERFGVDRIVIEPVPWPGNPSKALDETNLGKYFFEVRDRATNRLLFSRGFASIYGEWETTGEARTEQRVFSESLRFPKPEAAVQVVLKKRDAQNAFREIWSTIVDPDGIFVDGSRPPSPGPVIEIQRSGDSASKVDVLILGDGYTATERGKFERDARRLVDLLFATSPFKEHRSDFNVWAICPLATESDISRPSTGLHRRSPLGATYDAFGSERYILSFENRALRDVASFAPYEFVEIITNSRTYGGGGIFNLYGTVAADSAQAPYIFVHEFGHHFAGLADEYYASPVAYLPATNRIEPWEPNVTALLDPKSLKWRDLVSASTPLPTPWRKDDYEAHMRDYAKRREQIRADRRPEEEMEALFGESRAFDTTFFAAEAHAAAVGAFEGAMYEAKGYYRPQADCIMFSRSPSFCAVCRRAIERIIELYAAI